MEPISIMNWIRLSIAILVYVGSCIGLGYLAGVWSHRRRWSRKVCILITVIISLIYPAILIFESWYFAATCRIRTPDQVCDAPLYALMGVILFVAPVLFLLSLGLVLTSALQARRKQRG